MIIYTHLSIVLIILIYFSILWTEGIDLIYMYIFTSNIALLLFWLFLLVITDFVGFTFPSYVFVFSSLGLFSLWVISSKLKSFLKTTCVEKLAQMSKTLSLHPKMVAADGCPSWAWFCLRFNKSFSVPLSPSRLIVVVYLTNILGSLTYNIKRFDVTAVVNCCWQSWIK